MLFEYINVIILVKNKSYIINIVENMSIPVSIIKGVIFIGKNNLEYIKNMGKNITLKYSILSVSSSFILFNLSM
ncbi:MULTISPECIES: hypothetical protein [unclassified Candidatus Neoarthromitus]|uniref:hypothetical protein n=1 Tax=unclassified Candidatus Neoarthromitus TaxID=2638829 RepID=UPI001565396B|nr:MULTISPECIES: hypothetical protein [unclassified Candidatus Arthromitus]